MGRVQFLFFFFYLCVVSLREFKSHSKAVHSDIHFRMMVFDSSKSFFFLFVCLCTQIRANRNEFTLVTLCLIKIQWITNHLELCWNYFTGAHALFASISTQMTIYCRNVLAYMGLYTNINFVFTKKKIHQMILTIATVDSI